MRTLTLNELDSVSGGASGREETGTGETTGINTGRSG